MMPIAVFSPGCARDTIHARACLVAVNFTPEVYCDYRIRVPLSGIWREVLNTDSAIYGGSNVGNARAVSTLDEGNVPEVSLAIPPLAAIFLVPQR
jgi:1,4-alpha-glucan branching enzyme